MPFALSESIAIAKAILGQNVSDETRYPTARLVTHGNAAVQRCAEIYPDLFATEVWMDMSNGVEQTVPTSLGCRKLRAVLSFRLGADENAVRPMDPAFLAAWRPGWRTDVAALPQHATLIPGRIDAFICYPPADAAMDARISYVKVLPSYASEAEIPLPRTLIPLVADYMAGMAEMADEEHVNSTRASQLLASFVAGVGAMTGAKPAP